MFSTLLWYGKWGIGPFNDRTFFCMHPAPFKRQQQLTQTTTAPLTYCCYKLFFTMRVSSSRSSSSFNLSSVGSVLLLATALLTCVPTAVQAETKGLESVKLEPHGVELPAETSSRGGSKGKDKTFKQGLPVPLVPGLETRIVGGETVTSKSDYPFFVQWIGCGGTLVHDDSKCKSYVSL